MKEVKWMYNRDILDNERAMEILRSILAGRPCESPPELYRLLESNGLVESNGGVCGLTDEGKRAISESLFDQMTYVI